jgi:hypothetical protein
VPLVANVLARMLAPEGEAWVADPYRVAAEDFPRALDERGLSCTIESVQAMTAELGLVCGTLHHVRRSATP